MKANTIILKPDRLELPLSPVSAGKLSSAVLIVSGEIPDDIEALAVKVSKTDGSLFTAAATEVEGSSPRSFRCYLSPFYFPDASEALQYHVVGMDVHGNPRWLGSGVLRVHDNPADGSPIVPEVIPADTYVRNPVTGLYHKLTAAVNELGELSIDLESEGIQR